MIDARAVLWRTLQVLVPIVVFAALWTAVPKPVINHTSEWEVAQQLRTNYQIAGTDETALAELWDSVDALVAQAQAELPTISNPVERLERLAYYETVAQDHISKHPLYPSHFVTGRVSNELRQAAGIDRVLATESAMATAIQENRDFLAAGLNRQQELIGKYYLMGYSEPAEVSVPYYTLWALRWILLFAIAGWMGALVQACKLWDYGWDPLQEARSNLGSWPAIILVAPFCNLFLLESYEKPPWGKAQSPQSHSSQIILRTSSAIGALPLMFKSLWQDIGWRDVLKLSHSFRYATVASMAMVVNLTVMSLAWAGDAIVVESQTFLDESGGASHSIKLVLPDPGGGKWQFDFDPEDLDGSFAAGYRGQLIDLGQDLFLQPRYIVATSEGKVEAVKLQGLILGTAGTCPYYAFSSLRLPRDGRCSIYNEAAIDLGSTMVGDNKLTLTGIVIESHKLGYRAEWKIGPELRFDIGDLCLKFHHGCGLGGTADESRAWLTYAIPIN